MADFQLQRENNTLKQLLVVKDNEIALLKGQISELKIQNEELQRGKKLFGQPITLSSGVSSRASLALKNEEMSKVLSPTSISQQSHLDNGSRPSPFNFTSSPHNSTQAPSSTYREAANEFSQSPRMNLDMNLQRPSASLSITSNINTPTAGVSDSVIMGALPFAPKSSKKQDFVSLTPMGSFRSNPHQISAHQHINTPSQQSWRQSLQNSDDSDDEILPPPAGNPSHEDFNPPPPPDSEMDANEMDDFIPPPPQFDLSSGLIGLNLTGSMNAIDFSTAGGMSNNFTFGSAYLPSDTTVVHPVENSSQSMFVEKTGSQNGVVMKARCQPSASTVFPIWEPPATGQHKVYVPAPDCLIVRVHEGQSELDLTDPTRAKNLQSVNQQHQPVVTPGFDYNPLTFAPKQRDSFSVINSHSGPASPQESTLAAQIGRFGNVASPPSTPQNTSSQSFGHSVSNSTLVSPSAQTNGTSSRNRGRSQLTNYSLPTNNNDSNAHTTGQHISAIKGVRSPSQTRQTLAERQAVASGIPSLPSSGPSCAQQQMQQIRHQRRTSGHYFPFNEDLSPSQNTSSVHANNPATGQQIALYTPQTENTVLSSAPSSSSNMNQSFSVTPIEVSPSYGSSSHLSLSNQQSFHIAGQPSLNSTISPHVINTTFDSSAFRNDKNQINGKPKHPSLNRRTASTLAQYSTSPQQQPSSSESICNDMLSPNSRTPSPQLQPLQSPSPASNSGFNFQMPDHSILFSLPTPPLPSLSKER